MSLTNEDKSWLNAKFDELRQDINNRFATLTDLVNSNYRKHKDEIDGLRAASRDKVKGDNLRQIRNG